MPSRIERRRERRESGRQRRRTFLLDASALLELFIPGSEGQTEQSRDLVDRALIRGASISAVQWLEVLDKCRERRAMSPEDVERRLRVYRLEVEPVTKDVATTAARSPRASRSRR